MDRAIKVLAWCAAIMACGLIALAESWMHWSEWSVLLIIILPMLALAILTLMGRQIEALAWYSAVMVCILVPAWVAFILLLARGFGITLEPGEIFLEVALPGILLLPILGLAVLILIRKRRGL
jgi:hypothetical protein